MPEPTVGAAVPRRRRRGARRACVLVLAAGAVAACSSGDDGAATDDPTSEEAATVAALPDGWDGYVSDVYADDANWLCRPGAGGDVCRDENLDATSIDADLTLTTAPHEPADDPAVDCFYVYPTVSQDEGVGADRDVAENQEVWVVRNQAARLTASCRVFAPVYRQRTISAIGGAAGEAGEAAADVAYEDVLDAFRHYLANDNEGRGVVVVGHSQGAGILTRLLAAEVDDQPALRDRLVAAYLLGTTVEVPAGEVVGGTFASLPLCEADDQTGCVVTYATFRADAPPPVDARFGRPWTDGLEAACVNPAALDGGTAILHPYFPTEIPDGALSGAVQGTTMERLGQLDTGWVTMPDFVEAECAESDGATYLAATVGGAGDQRGSDVGGDLGPTWGLHLVDVNIAMGDIVRLVGDQAAAYTADHPA